MTFPSKIITTLSRAVNNDEVQPNQNIESSVFAHKVKLYLDVAQLIDFHSDSILFPDTLEPYVSDLVGDQWPRIFQFYWKVNNQWFVISFSSDNIADEIINVGVENTEEDDFHFPNKLIRLSIHEFIKLIPLLSGGSWLPDLLLELPGRTINNVTL